MYFIITGLNKVPKNRPKITPRAPASPKAKTTANNTVIVDLVCEDAAKAANWVLSPISAKKIVINVLAKIFQSIPGPLN